jgi:hypothetical protein
MTVRLTCASRMARSKMWCPFECPLGRRRFLPHACFAWDITQRKRIEKELDRSPPEAEPSSLGMIHTCLSGRMFFLLKYLDSFSVTRRAHSLKERLGLPPLHSHSTTPRGTV